MLNELIKSGESEVQVIVFKLGSEEYAVPITVLQEIIMLQKATRIPKSVSYITGVINLRGTILPVIDGRKKFKLESVEEIDQANQRIMILEVDGDTVGLIVDSVAEVVRLQVESIDPPPVDFEEGGDIFWGIGKYQERLLILLNCEKILTINEDSSAEVFNKVTETIKQSKAVS